MQQQIKQQMEFYFGDVNLYQDQYNRDLLATNNNKIKLEQINKTFPKLMQMNVTVQQIADALKDSEILVVDEELNLCRKVPYEFKSFSDQTVYIKGIPKHVPIQNQQKFFEQIGVKPDLIKPRKDLKNQIKGSSELIFQNKDKYIQFLTLFGNQKEEIQQKSDACIEHFKQPKFDDFKKPDFLMSHKDFLIQNLIAIPMSAHKDPELQQQIKTYFKGLIIKIINIGVIGLKKSIDIFEVDPKFIPKSQSLQDQIVTRQLLQQVFQKYGEIKFVDFNLGDQQAFIRFRECSPEAAMNIVLDQQKQKFVIGNNEVSVSILENEEESKYWSKIFESGDKKWMHKKDGKRDNKRGGRRW